MGLASKRKTTTATFSTLLLLLLLLPLILDAQSFGPFNHTYYDIFSVVPNATISNQALQITPDSAGNYPLANQSGRILFRQQFKLWEPINGGVKVASFNTSFVINIFRVEGSPLPGEGLAFLIAPDLDQTPPGSHGQYLGLTNSTTDSDAGNRFVAVEFDTVKQDFDPDSNHIGLDINSVRSNKTASLSDFGLQLAPNGTAFFHVWIFYNGSSKFLQIFMVDEKTSTPTKPIPTKPVLTSDLDISKIVNQNSYFGFAASTGSSYELNCVLGWNLTVEDLGSDDKGGISAGLKLGLGIGLPVLAIVVFGLAGLWYFAAKRRAARDDPNILGALKSLPGTPREFSFRELRKATANFDEKNKLGEGGFGVVYKGVLTKENYSEIAVKKFSRDKIKSKDDFLAELTIINRLRHKHLVQLRGWCYKNGMLLLVYEYMPNGSLDAHIFCGPEKKPLSWNHRHKILSGVASALHYLHNEYDQTVLHRDLKASNILLDNNFNARLGDFGLARAIDNERTSYAELDGVQGTIGYIAPECLHTGRTSGESDVFGFGAVILEVVCGQKPWRTGKFQYLVDWVWSLHRDGRLLEAVDPRLGEDYVKEEAQKLLLLGLACSHPMASERPTTQTIIQILTGSVAVPPVPHFKPAFVWPAMGTLNLDGITADTTQIVSSQYGSEWTDRESFAGLSDVSIV